MVRDRIRKTLRNTRAHVGHHVARLNQQPKSASLSLASLSCVLHRCAVVVSTSKPTCHHPVHASQPLVLQNSTPQAFERVTASHPGFEYQACNARIQGFLLPHFESRERALQARLLLMIETFIHASAVRRMPLIWRFLQSVQSVCCRKGLTVDLAADKYLIIE